MHWEGLTKLWVSVNEVFFFFLIHMCLSGNVPGGLHIVFDLVITTLKMDILSLLYR